MPEMQFANTLFPVGEAMRREKIKGRVETQPRFKIQYPMKNHGKDAVSAPKRRNKSLKFLQNECCL